MKKGTISAVMRHLAARRTKKLSPEKREEIAGKGGKSAWARMSKEERSAEMKRRAKVREKNRAAKKSGASISPKKNTRTSL